MGSVKVNELSKADAPTLDMMKLNWGQLYRNGRYPPFQTRKWKSKIVVCARWDRTTDEGALREWLDHHRCVTGTPKPSLPCMGFEPIVGDVDRPGDASLLPFCGFFSSRTVQSMLVVSLMMVLLSCKLKTCLRYRRITQQLVCACGTMHSDMHVTCFCKSLAHLPGKPCMCMQAHWSGEGVAVCG